MSSILAPSPATLLHQYFGYSTFRPHQKQIIDAVLAGRDALCIMPTGGGKSICYQIPALAKNGLAVVISPLIALMKDQVDGLLANGVPAAFLNSTQSVSEQKAVAEQIRAGTLKILYISPEKAVGEGMLNYLGGLPISLLAIDEAHCISSWGHDFRPEYRQLARIRTFLQGNPPMMALTATADKLTRRDIISRLEMLNPAEFISSFDRPNISLQVLPGEARSKQIIRFVKRREGESGIIYCLSRKGCESMAAALQKEGVKADYYHAGLDAPTRARVQEAFIRDDVPIICATIAFGMGIDKSNVRFVMHYNLPKNLESYYQEIGRAGRDGLPSEAVLFYTYADVQSLMEMMLNENPSPDLQELFRAKLDRMQSYATATMCRRRILLSYFGEDIRTDCGNCDVCKNPRPLVDGTVIAQKALSAVVRGQGSVSRSVLVDVLRGNATAAVRDNGLDMIKTFGAGKDISPIFWREYIGQLLNNGLMEIAYDQHHALTITEAGRRVLFEGAQVRLSEPVIHAKKSESSVPTSQTVSPTYSQLDAGRVELFAQLKILRKRLADEENIAAFQVFSDATLMDMATYLPQSEFEFDQVSGVGNRKAERYWRVFTELIADFASDKMRRGTPLPGKERPAKREARAAKRDGEDTKLTTLRFWNAGMSLDAIAQERALGKDTIIGHLIHYFLLGEQLDLSQFLSKAEFDIIKPALLAENAMHAPTLKPVHERLGGRYTYGQINLTKAYMQKGTTPL